MGARTTAIAAALLLSAGAAYATCGRPWAYCDSKDDCCDALFCNGGNECEDCKGEFVTCYSSDMCCDGFVCSDGKCVKPCASVGGSCDDTSDCCDGLECDDHECVEPKCGDPWDSCDADSDCCEGLECKGRECVEKPPPPPLPMMGQCPKTGNGRFADSDVKRCVGFLQNKGTLQATCGTPTCDALCNEVCGRPFDLADPSIPYPPSSCNNRGGGNCKGAFGPDGTPFNGGPCCGCYACE